MRGKGKDIDRTGRAAGITPACAGKSCISVRLSGLRGDHPRMCGEKESIIGGYVSTVGSPPHVRGKANIGRSFLHVRGITPAYAGKRMETMTRRHAVGDHPRVCGEKVDLARMPASKPGSPPRMRGKDFWHYADNYATGITPAYAGKSAQLEGASPLAQDHPRVCGEKRDFSRLPPFLQGSPPRMRGKGERKRRHSNPRGITPAYAGKSSELSS